MRALVTTARILTGFLFIFSGLVKAIDPLGLAYKMEEFFEAWANSGFMKSTMETLTSYSLAFSILMITLEVAAGFALLIGWQKKITTWILLLLMMFFTFLTSYVLFTGKIRACGCFGDCIPLTPIQTFSKDIILLIFTVILLLKREYIMPLAKPFFSIVLMLFAIVLTIMLQLHVLKHLPLADCLPFKKGNDILQLRKMPANAIQDKFDYVFVYEKNGEKKPFPVSALPDSSWKFVERKETLVEKGSNNVPAISDFSLTDNIGNDVTDSILINPNEYYLFFLKEIPENIADWINEFRLASAHAAAQHKKIYIVTAQRTVVEDLLNSAKIEVNGVLTADATAIKTAARATPTIFKLKGPVILEKLSWADIQKVYE
ncbi:MAG: BT_3928 family protein [Ferruginibacter sp.]